MCALPILTTNEPKAPMGTKNQRIPPPPPNLTNFPRERNLLLRFYNFWIPANVLNKITVTIIFSKVTFSPNTQEISKSPFGILKLGLTNFEGWPRK